MGLEGSVGLGWFIGLGGLGWGWKEKEGDTKPPAEQTQSTDVPLANSHTEGRASSHAWVFPSSSAP